MWTNLNFEGPEKQSFAAFWYTRSCHAFNSSAPLISLSAIYLIMASQAGSINHVCQADLCSHQSFAGGLCRKHAALKLLTSPTSHSKPHKLTPMQLYRTTVDMPSASRAHYDAILHQIDSVLSPRRINFEIANMDPNEDREAAAGKCDTECCEPTTAVLQPQQSLTRSSVAR
jgi:hypothetical protein